MIKVTFRLDEDDTLCGVGKMPHTPRVGEYVWIQNKPGKGPRMVSVRVTRVAYWVPNLDGGYSIPCVGAVAYVEPVKEQE